MPPVTKNLIIINLIIWLFMFITFSSQPGVYGNVMKYGALHYFTAPDFNPAQLFTYMFMHSTQSIAHVFFNMFTLFFFGTAIERTLGSGRFLFYYISCGIGAALIQEGVWALTWVNSFCDWFGHRAGLSADTVKEMLNETLHSGQGMEVVNMFLNNAMLTIGASGSVYGVLLAFAMIYPNQPMYLFFIPIPIKAKYMVAGFMVIEILMGLSNAAGFADSVAHFAHLGGMLFGFFMIWYWKRRGDLHRGF
ncbi:MAG: rhomboid family intramembrane serine protease [Muribaculaceae bacterium]|nr:rhomboid family intramembrane serine protease [Muribaculaceae bacterium]